MNIRPSQKNDAHRSVRKSASFKSVEGFIHLEVSVDRNACTDRHLLGPQGEIVGACSGANFDKNLAMVSTL
jgi:hypothetical protein